MSIDEDLKRAIQGSVLYRPDELPALREQVHQLQGAPKSAAAKIEVTGETTLAAASRLVVDEGERMSFA